MNQTKTKRTARTRQYPVLWRYLKHGVRRKIATPAEMVRFGGQGRLDDAPRGFVIMTRARSRREAVRALYGRGADDQLAAR